MTHDIELWGLTLLAVLAVWLAPILLGAAVTAISELWRGSTSRRLASRPPRWPTTPSSSSPSAAPSPQPR